jgi:hypothetical protein
MPTHIRAQCSWQVGSTLPRDRVQITPCFRHQLGIIEGAPDWQTLADDLHAGLTGWASPVIGNSNELTVKLYEIGKPPPNRPQATKVSALPNAAEASIFREMACCLSFYGGSNNPNQRGRLYIPLFLASSGTTPGVRPSTTVRDKIGTLAPIFAGLGGVNVDWIVWSPTKQAATRVTNWWVDDEFDVQRRRGLRPTARTSGTTGG